MKELNEDFQKDRVDTNYKFSKEWAKDEEEAKRIQNEYLEQITSSQSLVFDEIIRERPKEAEINLITKPVSQRNEEQLQRAREQKALNHNLEQALEKARKQRTIAIIVAILCAVLIFLILFSGANKKEELEIDTTDTVQTQGS
ncbi:MAG: hypothetical protein Q4F05_17890 [bacterium]|nr:hypothetical protein [bacterium]